MIPSPLPRRIAHAFRWRAENTLVRARAMVPQFLPVLRELRIATGRSSADLARDLLAAWRVHGVSAHDFANLMLWAIPKERWHEYVVGGDLECFLVRTLDSSDRQLSRDKAAFAETDRRKGLPWLPTLAVINRRDGIPIVDARPITTPVELWTTLTELVREDDHRVGLVVKPSCGERGRGFFRISPDVEIRDGAGQLVDRQLFAETVLNYRHRLGDYGYLVQPALSPHPDITRLTGVDALASVRIVTALKDGVPHVIESFLKIPGPGRLVDNFLSGSKGTTIARFDPADGRLSDLVGLLRPGFRHVLERASSHPLTGRRVAGEQLSCWRELLEIAYRAARAHPQTVAIGWDVAIAASGCVILDGNPNWGPGWEPCASEGVRARLARLYPTDF